MPRVSRTDAARNADAGTDATSSSGAGHVAQPTRFHRSLTTDPDVPVEWVFTHATCDGAALGDGVRPGMTGPHQGRDLAAVRRGADRGQPLVRVARACRLGPITPLRVVDRYADPPASQKADARPSHALPGQRPELHTVGRDARGAGKCGVRAGRRVAQPRRDRSRWSRSIMTSCPRGPELAGAARPGRPSRWLRASPRTSTKHRRTPRRTNLRRRP
jgi:hypothetical protein